MMVSSLPILLRGLLTLVYGAKGNTEGIQCEVLSIAIVIVMCTIVPYSMIKL